jgi:hypothetical protein
MCKFAIIVYQIYIQNILSIQKIIEFRTLRQRITRRRVRICLSQIFFLNLGTKQYTAIVHLHLAILIKRILTKMYVADSWNSGQSKEENS